MTRFFAISAVVIALAVGFCQLATSHPGSGLRVQRSDGLIKGVPLGIELVMVSR